MNRGRTVSPAETNIDDDNDRQNDELGIEEKSLKKGKIT